MVTGELVETVSCYETVWENGADATILGNYERRVFTADSQIFASRDILLSTGIHYCNVSDVLAASWNDDSPHYAMGNNTMILWLPVGTDPNTPIKFVGVSKNPITHQMSSQLIKSRIGDNTFWTNYNGNIEVKYWTH